MLSVFPFDSYLYHMQLLLPTHLIHGMSFDCIIHSKVMDAVDPTNYRNSSKADSKAVECLNENTATHLNIDI